MTITTITESIVEEATLGWFKALGYQYLAGPDIACDGITPERASYADVVLSNRLQNALSTLNKHIPAESLEDAFRKITRSESPSLDR